MKEHWGQAEQALRDTLVHKAERKALENLGRLYGFERPRTEISERAHGAALEQAAYARRGTKVSMFDIIERSFSDFVRLEVDLTMHPSFPDQIISPISGLAGSADELAHDYTYRYIRTSYGVHLVTRTEYNVFRAGIGFGCSVLHLCSYEHTYWTSLPAQSETTLTNIYLLPFVLRETIPGPIDEEWDDWTVGDECLAEISLLDYVLPDVPPSYLLDDGDEETPDGMPFGSQLLDGPHVDGNPAGIGPHPMYLYDGEGFSGLKFQLERLMGVGLFLRIVHDP